MALVPVGQLLLTSRVSSLAVLVLAATSRANAAPKISISSSATRPLLPHPDPVTNISLSRRDV